MNLQNHIKFKALLAAIRCGFYFSTYISLVDYGLTDADLQELLDTLDKSPKVKARIESIDLSNTVVAGPSANTLTCVILERFPNLKTLILSRNKIHILILSATPKLEILSAAINRLNEICGLEHLELLRELDIRGNIFTEIDLSKATILEKFLASSNRFRGLNLAGKTKLHTALVDANPLVTVFIAGSPLNTKFSITERFLDEASKIEIANYRCQLENQSIVANVDYFLHMWPFNANARLTTKKLIDRFEQICVLQAEIIDSMLGAARANYCDMLRVLVKLDAAVVHKIVFDAFAANANTYLRQCFQVLLKPSVATDDGTQEHNQLIQQFLENEFKQLLATRLAKAKKRFFSPKFNEVLAKRYPEKAKAIAEAKQDLEMDASQFEQQNTVSYQPGFFLLSYNQVRSRVNTLINYLPAITSSYQTPRM